MIPRIDWISYILTVGKAPVARWRAYGERMHAMAADRSPHPIASLIDGADWDIRPGRHTYKHWMHRVGGGLDIFGSPDRNDMLIEVSGIGCAEIASDADMLALLKPIASNVTRIDLAADILSDVSPSYFCERRSNHRFRTFSHHVSDTGETVYIGSRFSDKFARVYRYHEPHPRYDFLRAEHVFKGRQAKASAAYVVTHGIRDGVVAAGNYYGWEHPVWIDHQSHPEELSAWVPDRGGGDSLRWVIKQVLPALYKLETDGVIPNVREFIDAHLPDNGT